MLLSKTLRFVSAVVLMIITQSAFAQQPALQYFRPYDQRGVNVFETSKRDTVEYTGLKMRFGANFTQGYQNLNHSNKARAVVTFTDTKVYPNVTYRGIETAEGSGEFVFSGVPNGQTVTGLMKNPKVYGGYIDDQKRQWTNTNQVYEQSGGFPLAQANFNIDVQLADGVRVSLVSYMSSHHHNEFWVKGGYFQIDKVSFLNNEFINKLWENLTLRVGHMEINYGDAHFRRSDGGNTLWNPFVENNLMDAFDTEIGAELYWQKYGVIAMAAVTDGEIQGSVTRPEDRSPSFYGKVGYDNTFGENLRARLTGSLYTTKSSISNNLYSGDRTGSNYQFILDPVGSTVTGAFRSGRINPGLSDNITAWVINPFVSFQGLEMFGTYEVAKGNSITENDAELDDRKFTQYAIDLIYRFGKRQEYYVGGRYNQVDGTMAAPAQGDRYDVTVDRTSFGAGWFITKNILLKGEYVQQNYKGYPDTNILHQGKFDGFVVQGVIGF